MPNIPSTIIDSLDELDLTNKLIFWVITHDTKDYGDKFVVRRETAAVAQLFIERACEVCDTLDEARSKVPAGLTRMPHSLADDPVIVESWF